MTTITIDPEPYPSSKSNGDGGPKKASGGWPRGNNGLGRGLLMRDIDDFMHSSSVAAAHVAIRMGFLRKVLGILSAQLIFTTLVGAIFVYTPGLKGLVQQWSWMLLLGFILSIGLLMAMVVKRQEAPTNYILLFCWTLVEAYLVGTIASFYDQDIVILAVFLTASVVMGLAIYALQTKRDFSMWGSGLFAVLWILIIGGILQMFLMSEMMEFVLAAAGAVLFSLFIIYDLQEIMHRTSPEEYIMATINLYLDIINLFLHILRLLNAAKRHT